MDEYLPRLAKIYLIEMECHVCGKVVERGKKFAKATCFDCRMDKLRATSREYQKAKSARLKHVKSKKCFICKKYKKETFIHDKSPTETKGLTVRYVCYPCARMRMKIYIKTDSGKIALTKMRKYYDETFPEKLKARGLLNYNISKGVIIKPRNCSICNKTGRIEGHHDNYEEPLKVKWLCVACHKNEHKIK